MTENREYHGRTNYETWAVGRFLDGNYTGEHTYQEVLELANYRVGHVYALADDLKEWFEEQLPELEGIASDLMNAAVSKVNWQELAGHKLEEIEAS